MNLTNKMNRTSDLKNYLREKVFFISLITVVCVFPFSEALISISTVILLIQAILLGSWNHPSVKSRNWKIVLFPVSVFVVYLIGAFFTKDFSFALYELRKVIFWIIIPPAIFLSPKLSEKESVTVLSLFVAAVFVAGTVITATLIFDNYNGITDFRERSVVSHIRFSIQVVVAISILVWLWIEKIKKRYSLTSFLIGILIISAVLLLLLLKSLVGITAFAGAFTVFSIIYTGRVKNIKIKLLLILIFVLILISPALHIYKIVHDFYDISDPEPDSVELYTSSGNPYSHNFDDLLRENGNRVNLYVCEKEMRNEWNKLSEIKYDDDLKGYMLGSTLIRYLTSLDYRKDSTGVSRLTVKDIQAIENGITNYKFKNNIFSLYPRIYETIWELDDYYRTGNPNNKTLAQRIEYLKASFLIIRENPVFGIGTGNWKIKYDAAYDKTESKLSYNKRESSHNQYINYIVKFGVAGFVWILFALIYPLFKTNNNKNILLILFLAVYAFANLGDANMETHMGLTFFTIFYSFFIWNSHESMNL